MSSENDVYDWSSRFSLFYVCLYDAQCAARDYKDKTRNRIDGGVSYLLYTIAATYFVVLHLFVEYKRKGLSYTVQRGGIEKEKENGRRSEMEGNQHANARPQRRGDSSQNEGHATITKKKRRRTQMYNEASRKYVAG